MTTSLSLRSRKDKVYRARLARGETITVPIETVREHIRGLADLGLTHQMIANAAGVGKQTITFILERNTSYTMAGLADRILEVDHHPRPSQPLVLGIGAQRRVRALMALGWSVAVLAEKLGYQRKTSLQRTINRTHISYDNWARIRDLYNELSMTPGPSPVTANRAKRRRYMPPLAWWGRDIDHPHTQPDWGAAGVKLRDRPVCSKGHPWTATNTGRDHHGDRRCLACLDLARQRAKERYAATRAANRGVYGKQS